MCSHGSMAGSVQAWDAAGFDPLLLEGKLPQLRFGTWVGGDRDGHALVTAGVTQESLTELRLGAMLVYERMLSELAEKMSLSVFGQTPPLLLEEALGRMAQQVGSRAAWVGERDEEEPWRQFVHFMAAKLPLLKGPEPQLIDDSGQGYYQRPEEMAADLKLLGQALEAVGAGRLLQCDVQPVLRALECFGFHLATLDIRQNSAWHDRALAELMVAAGLDGAGFPDWPESDRLRFLNTELRSPRPFLNPGADVAGEAAAVLECYRVVAAHIERYGEAGVGALIVSMTRSLSDLLVVFVLAREAGLMRLTESGLVSLLPVVPLFETVDDLEGSATILRAFLEHPVARASLEKQAQGSRPVQQVMVGYSDSNKDRGIFASQWALQKGQAAMAAVGDETGVKLRFFHGRGGTISRGAGPTHRFLDALPRHSLSGDIRLTEQGETIAQKFGNRATAAYNLEILVAGVAYNTMRGRDRVPLTPELEALASRIAFESGRHYSALLHAPGFIEFFRSATPIDALEHSRIGSRPARRTGQASLEDLRAIPWVFSWNQSRYYLPGWYGVGTALLAIYEQEPEQFETLKQSIASWRFMRYVLTNVETNLASTDFDLMRDYAGLVHDEGVREQIFGLIGAEWHAANRALELLWGGTIATRRPRMLKTLQVRAEALHVLHAQQIELLQRWRALSASGDQHGAEALLPQLLVSINAIASGLRTTG